MTQTRIPAETTATAAQQGYLTRLRAELETSTKNRITVRKAPAGMLGSLIVTEYDRATGDKATATISPDGAVVFG
jgi:hypothetical protein